MNEPPFESVPLQIHPRVFAALGADLVTSDVVAIIELVKNSYDALAENVWIRFTTDENDEPIIEIEDDGLGMDREAIDNVWCVVATPEKRDNPQSKFGSKSRRVVGEKGLGRLSVARLGNQLQIITKESRKPCLEVLVDWGEISDQSLLSECRVQRRVYPEKPPFGKSGTKLSIGALKSEWDESEVAELKENLARLISPFQDDLGDFKIWLSVGAEGLFSEEAEEVDVEFPDFLSKPKYKIEGEVDVHGNVTGTYRFRPISRGRTLQRKLRLTWEQVFDGIQDAKRRGFCDVSSRCGPFSFEIRGWDLAPNDTAEISEKFNFSKSAIRRSINVHQGISVYRDGVLVLPKSVKARDWLGLDLRRVSKVGTRLSTSQIVGYVAISGDSNPGLLDTSDRESLVANDAASDFEEILVAIVRFLEVQRQLDRHEAVEEKPTKSLFEGLSAENLLTSINELADEGAEASEAVPLVAAFKDSLDTDRKEIEERFIHYSRMATVGTIAHMLVHEIRSRTTSMGKFLDDVNARFGPFNDPMLAKYYRLASNSVSALERLADTFSPLANRSFTRRKKDCIIEEVIRDSLAMVEQEIERKKIKCTVPNSKTRLAMDSGELGAVIMNMITNSLYWLGEVNKDERRLGFKIKKRSDGKRAQIWVSDSGPGVSDEIVDKILQPGVTRRPNGIGMGLTVASEIVDEYGGRVVVKANGLKGGATFGFDVPLK